jgi:hypothetical protein
VTASAQNDAPAPGDKGLRPGALGTVASTILATASAAPAYSLAATIAFALERRERWRLLWLLIPQRIGYRQVMYYVVLKAIAQALRGPLVGWGKLARTGRVTAN